MSFVLLLLGLMTTAAGVAMVGFGIPINEFSLGNTLIISGMTAIAGGIIVVALSFVLRQLGHIANLLAGRAAPNTGRPAGEPLDPMHPGSPRSAAPRAPYPSGSRPDGLPRDPRTTDPRMASEPGYALPPRNVEPSLVAETDDMPLSPRPPLRPNAAGAEQSERKGWLPGNRNAARGARPGAAETPRAPDAPFERAAWPAEPRAPQSGERGDGQHPDALAHRGNGDATRHAAPAEAAKPDAPVTVLKSGVVDGMAYTLYTDGSIEAELAQGVVRFGSIEELRNHLEKSA